VAEWHKLTATADMPPGTAREFTVAGRIVALFNVDGTFYALDGVCPHAGGPLGEGQLNGRVVTCPWHGWQFDVTTGRHILSPQIAPTKFPVRIDGDSLSVELP
jgi:nitrite reductase (NADH) small subunit